MAAWPGACSDCRSCTAYFTPPVAAVLVGIAAALLNATAAPMKRAVDLIEILSYSLIILIGVRLLWVKERVFLATLRTLHRPAAVGAAVTPAHSLHDHGHHDHQHDHAHAHAHAHGHGHAHADHDHDHHQHCDGHAQDHAHHHHDHDDHASAWGHAHAPEPEELAGPGGWK